MEPRTKSPNPLEGKGVLRVLGRYHCHEIVRERPPLVTYRARTQGLAGFERAFAVTCFVPDGARFGAELEEVFLALGRRLQGVKDGRIGQVVESNRAEGTAFVAREFVLGASLETIASLTRQAAADLPPEWPALLAHVGSEIAEALAVAHGQAPPVVHGGLGATNVFVTNRGAVKVVDFGLHVVIPASDGVGARYAAPELDRGESKTPASDLYALGALLFELATGKDPPTARAPRTATDIQTLLRPMGAGLARAVGALLGSNAAERPKAATVAKELRVACQGLSETETRVHLAALLRKLGAGGGTPVVGVPIGGARSPANAAEPEEDTSVQTPRGKAGIPRQPRARTGAQPVVRSSPSKTKQGPGPQLPPPVEPGKPRVVSLASLFDGRQAARPRDADGVPVGPIEDRSAAVLGSIPEASGPAHETAEIPASEEAAFTPSDFPVFEPTASLLPPGRGKASPAPPEHTTNLDAGDLLDALEEVTDEPAPPPMVPAAVPPPRTPVVAGKVPDSKAPNLSNLTTAELDVMFAAGLKPPAASGAPSAPAPPDETSPRRAPTLETPTDFDEEVPTSFYARKDATASDAAPSGEATQLTATAGPEAEQPSPPAPVAPDQEAPKLFHADLDDMPKPARGRLWLLVVGAIACVAVGATVTLVLTRRAPAPIVTAPVPAAPRPTPPPAAPDPAPEPTTVANNAESATKDSPDPTAAAETAPPEPTTEAADEYEEPAGKGRQRIRFETNPPGATVWIGSAARGKTPVSLTLRPGVAKLVVIRPGFRTIRESVSPAQVPKATWTRALEPTSAPRPGKARLNVECTTPDKYPVSIDGEETGLLCPVESLALAPGAHEVSIFVPWRGKSYPLKVTLRAGATKVVRYPK